MVLYAILQNIFLIKSISLCKLFCFSVSNHLAALQPLVRAINSIWFHLATKRSCKKERHPSVRRREGCSCISVNTEEWSKCLKKRKMQQRLPLIPIGFSPESQCCWTLLTWGLALLPEPQQRLCSHTLQVWAPQNLFPLFCPVCNMFLPPQSTQACLHEP